MLANRSQMFHQTIRTILSCQNKYQISRKFFTAQTNKLSTITTNDNKIYSDNCARHSLFYNKRYSSRLISSYSFKMPTEPVLSTKRKHEEDEEIKSTDFTKSRILDNDYPFLEDDKEFLKTLEDSYILAKQELSSRWLDLRKTCYIYIYRGGGDPSDNLASFDLDGTIIKPKSNKRIPKNATDWELFSVWTKVKIQQVLKENNSRFVIFTNQNGVGLRLVALEEVQERIELVTKRLNIPCIVFVAIEKDEFRKPQIGMFKLFEKIFNNSIEINYEKSFYCGDAIGYPSHSDSDIKFAERLNIPFLPPDKFLRGVKPKLIGQQQQQIEEKR